MHLQYLCFFSFLLFCFWFGFILTFCHIDIDVCIYSTSAFFFFFFFDCQLAFDVDNVQRREFVNLYGVERYIRIIIIIKLFCQFFSLTS